MALLLLDIGNSRIKWRWHSVSDKNVVNNGVHSLLDESIDELFLQWREYGIQTDRCHMFYASVARAVVNEAVESWCKENAIPCVRVFSEPQRLDLYNCYADPLRLGVDRWLAMVAVRHQYKGTACVIDCGTATTADYVTEQGMHEGGLIMPGRQLMQQSLLSNTANIVMTGKSFVALPALGVDTDSAVVSGIEFINKANLEALVTSAQETGRQVFMTGGDSIYYEEMDAVQYVPELVVDGLSLVATDLYKKK